MDTPHSEFSLRTDGEQAERNREFARRVAAARPRKLGYDNALVRPAALSERPSRERIQPMPMTRPSTIRCFSPGPRLTVCRRSPRSARSISFRPSTRRCVCIARRSARLLRRRNRPRSTTRSPRSTAAARAARASKRCSTTSRRRRPRRRCRPSSARCRRVSPRITARSTSTRRCSPAIDALSSAARRARPHAEQMRCCSAIHLDFERAGARLADAAKARHAAIVERLATLSTRFAQNVLADEASLSPRAEGRARYGGTAGGPARGRAAAARERGESAAG